MRILIHDFPAYAFPIQLSRELARRGHTVWHAYCPSFLGPGGDVTARPDDPPTFSFEPIEMPHAMERQRLVRRRRQEIRYGRALAQRCRQLHPDVVLSGNTPLDAQRRLLRACRRIDARFVFWLQDLIGVGTRRVLHGRWLGLGSLVGEHFMRIEADVLRQSDAVIAITDQFRQTLADWRIDEQNIHTIPNWAAIDAPAPRPRDNPWSRQHGLHDKRCLLYAGTLGMKHNPSLLRQLAEHFADRDDVRVVVVSQGLGRDWLAASQRESPLPNLVLLDYQPAERVPDVLAAGDVLVAVLEPDAAMYSVPSKVLSYHVAGRAMLLAVPATNAAAQLVRGVGSGVCVEPDDTTAFVRAADQLLADHDRRHSLATAARRYAATAFDITTIADRFERVLRP